MSFISKKDKELLKMASGLPEKQKPWQHPPTPISIPSNSRPEIRSRGIQNPYAKSRFNNTNNSNPGRGSSGNPNSHGVFDSPPSRKRPKIRPTSTSFSRKPIDLTTEDAGSVLPDSTAVEDSDDSLNIQAKGRSQSRIASDGHAFRRLKAERRDVQSSKSTHSDTETDPIEEFPETKTENMGKVWGMVRKYEHTQGKTPTSVSRGPRPKATLGNPLALQPTPFTHGSKGKGKDIPPLSLSEWIRGTKHFAESREHFLIWGMGQNKPLLKVITAKDRPEFGIDMTRGMEGLQASRNGVSPLIIKFSVRSSRRDSRDQFFRSGYDDSPETIAFRVNTEDKSCNDLTRKALYEFLKEKCQCKEWLDSSGAEGAWNMALMELDYTAEPKARSLPTLDHASERRNSVSSDQELPSSIRLSPPPGLTPRTTLPKARRMNPRPMIRGQEETEEAGKEEFAVGHSNQPPRRSSRQSTLRLGIAAVDPTPPSPVEDPEELLLVYRPPGTGAVNITRGDLERLQPDKYLNDTLIEFGLKLWLSDLRDRDPELADQIHLFSSFFYKKLAVKDKRAGYESVRKWTSRVDVFSKKYLVVPINEHLHWYLAIIYQPECALRPAPLQPSPLTRKRKRDEERSVDSAVEASESRETPTTTSKPTSKATTEVLHADEMEIISASELTNSILEFEEQTQTDETSKPEEQEVETQLCLDVSSVSLDEHDGSHIQKGEQDGSIHGESMEIDYSPPVSPMPVDREVPIEDLTGVSTPLRTEVEDLFSKVPILEIENSLDLDAIPPEGFYGSSAVPSKTYGKKESRISVPGKLENDFHRGESGGDIRTQPLEAYRTYIFIFDSLNGKHPGAMKNLAQYLQFEATDKKGIENPTPPEAMTAHVPTQDNLCDCGLYLLHFAKVFMEDPAKSFHTILTKRKTPKADRNVDWKKGLVGTSREELTGRILALSEEWLKGRAKETEEKAKAKEKEGNSRPESIAVDSPEGSDDEVIVGEIVMKPDPPKKPAAKRPEPRKKASAGRGKGRVNSKEDESNTAEPERTAAERLR